MAVVCVLLMVALAANVALFAAFIAEKRRSDRIYNAMLDYVHRYVEDVSNSLEEQIAQEKMDALDVIRTALTEQNKNMTERFAEVNNRFAAVDQTYKALEMDYSQAQDAAKRINDFGTSLASIFDYDPMKAIQKGRIKEAS